MKSPSLSTIEKQHHLFGASIQGKMLSIVEKASASLDFMRLNLVQKHADWYGSYPQAGFTPKI